MESLNLHLVTYNVGTNHPNGADNFANIFPNGTTPGKYPLRIYVNLSLTIVKLLMYCKYVVMLFIS